MKVKFRDSFFSSRDFAMVASILGLVFAIGLSIIVDLSAVPPQRHAVAVSTQRGV